MKASDLMVGDWVSYLGFYNKVIYIGQKVSMYDGKGTEFTTDPEHIRPIPLTEEILVKNGVSEIHHPGTGATDEYSEWFLGGIKITEWLEDWKDHHFSTGGDDCSISFNYVHELQHLLRLCGIEKELVID